MHVLLVDLLVCVCVCVCTSVCLSVCLSVCERLRALTTQHVYISTACRCLAHLNCCCACERKLCVCLRLLLVFAQLRIKSEVMVTTAGTKYLGTPIGSEAFVNNFIEKKVAEWVSEIEQLSSIANMSHNQPMQHSHTALFWSGCSF